MEDYPIGTLVIRNPDYGWSSNKSDHFTVVGEVIGISKYGDPKVRSPDGEWYRYDDPKRQLIITKKPKKWSLPDDLFEI